MTRPKLKGNVTSIKIADIKEELEKAIKQGYSIKQILKIGLKVVNTKDESIKKLLENYEKLEDLRRSMDGLKIFMEGVSSLTPALTNLINEMRSLSRDVVKAQNILSEVVEKHKKNTDLYGEILEKINKQLSNIIELSKWKEKEIIKQKVEELDKLRLVIIQKFNLPASDPDIEKWGVTLANLRRLLKEE